MAFEEEEVEEDKQVGEAPDASAHHPYAASHDELFDIWTTVDPSYVISLIRKLLPTHLKNGHNGSDGCDRRSEESETGNMEESAASLFKGTVSSSLNHDSEDMDSVDDFDESSCQEGEDEDFGKSSYQLEKKLGKSVCASYGILLQVEIMQNSW